VAAPDLRGYNESDKPQGVEAYRMTELVEDVAGLIRALGEERAVIVGHDWGGALAYAFAMMRPEMTVRLAVLNCPHPAIFGRAIGEGDIAQLKKSWYMFFFQLPALPEALLAANNFRLLRRFAYDNARRGTSSRRDLARYFEAFAKPGALTGAVNWYRAMFRRPQGGREYPKIAAPTLVIWGTADHFLGARLLGGMRRYFAGPFRLARLPGVSHWVQQEAPKKVNDLLLRFLKRAGGSWRSFVRRGAARLPRDRDAQPITAPWSASSRIVLTRSATADGGSWAMDSHAASRSQARMSGCGFDAAPRVSSRARRTCSRAHASASAAVLSLRLLRKARATSPGRRALGAHAAVSFSRAAASGRAVMSRASVRRSVSAAVGRGARRGSGRRAAGDFRFDLCLRARAIAART
jgi:pimeloyl-ACP methyl ester carboxylesterase